MCHKSQSDTTYLKGPEKNIVLGILDHMIVQHSREKKTVEKIVRTLHTRVLFLSLSDNNKYVFLNDVLLFFILFFLMFKWIVFLAFSFKVCMY